MKSKLHKALIVFSALFALNGFSQLDSSTFEDFILAKPDTFYDNSISGSPIQSAGILYPPSDWNSSFSYWGTWWAVSNMTDTVTSGYTNQYSAKTGKGANGTSNYSVAYGTPRAYFHGANFGDSVLGFFVTNTTYAFNDMRDGSGFTKKFGGTSGSDPDWFRLTVKRWYKDTLRNDSVIFYLADFRFTNNSNDYILKNWQWVNCRPLGMTDSLQFSLSSSDAGAFGMNTPAYFALDDLKSKATMVGINSLVNYEDEIFVYPNPAQEFMNVSFPQNLNGEKIIFRIFDLAGKKMSESQVNYNPNSQINLTSLENGNYLLQIISDKFSKTVKFIKM